jgi:hypothetical protein
MGSKTPPVIEETNLSRAWGRAFLHVIDGGGKEIQPLLFSLSGVTEDGVVAEDKVLRQALDAALKAEGMESVHTVANTIFPATIWRLAKGDRHQFYAHYKEVLPRLVALDKKNRNDRGLYFSRMIAWDIDPKTGTQLAHVPVGSVPNDGNQLEWIISQFLSRKGVRRSMFRASVFDPARDHVPQAQLGFPCMQDLSFVPQPDAGVLAVNATYPTQQLFSKAYGNLLGLCRLGAFLAGEMKLRLDRVNCFVGIEKLDKPGKTAAVLQPVVAAARALIAAPEAVSEVAQ